MKKIFCIIFMALVVSTSFAGQEDAYNKTTDAKKIAWMSKGMDAVKLK